MEQRQVLEKVEQFVKKYFNQDSSGHDVEHMKRVAVWARNLAIEEGEDPFLCEVAGWLHDIGDRKLFKKPEEAIIVRDDFLRTVGFSEEDVETICNAIGTVSFSKGQNPRSLIGAIVQDADRLDAIGAIGIARAFAYGGSQNQPIYSSGGQSSIGHFHEKLLHLSTLINTESGKKEAEYRHHFMVRFLEEFDREQQLGKEGE
ncbi:uncharacterized protein SAMN04487936_10650 [Halobacillus dabanensis]|uniref:HD domain-containing protein n=1 Tax=Halobacillus dabanensis TaxID=240302 RepID=A0A1I3VXJ2_HALDA|nr:HD domain-containing protein [Halobacillus dabanensis]SFJ99057.1 uncharacterized protein SAMN04487936_10650 [Halobacillus dabanensis]